MLPGSSPPSPGTFTRCVRTRSSSTCSSAARQPLAVNGVNVAIAQSGRLSLGRECRDSCGIRGPRDPLCSQGEDPGLAYGHPGPGDLYRYVGASTEPVRIAVNGKSVPGGDGPGFCGHRSCGVGGQGGTALARDAAPHRGASEGGGGPGPCHFGARPDRVLPRRCGSAGRMGLRSTASRHRRHTERIPRRSSLEA